MMTDHMEVSMKPICLRKHISGLEDVLEKLQEAIEAIEEKQLAIEDNACLHDREMTAREQARYDKLEEEKEALESQADDIDNALDYLREYEEV